MIDDGAEYALVLEAALPSGHVVQFQYDERAGQVLIGWQPALPDDIAAFRNNEEWSAAYLSARDRFLRLISDFYLLDILIADAAGQVESVFRPHGAVLQ